MRYSPLVNVSELPERSKQFDAGDKRIFERLTPAVNKLEAGDEINTRGTGETFPYCSTLPGLRLPPDRSAIRSLSCKLYSHTNVCTYNDRSPDATKGRCIRNIFTSRPVYCDIYTVRQWTSIKYKQKIMPEPDIRIHKRKRFTNQLSRSHIRYP